MARVIFENLTKEQANLLSDWYCGQGEQDAYIWFQENGVKTPMTDCARKGGYRQIDKETGDVTVYCK